jgi:D-alanine-D-alanine ligase
MLPRVVLLHDAEAAGGRVDVSDVLLEAQHISKGLEAIGYETVILPVSLDLAELEAWSIEFAPIVAFNLMESIAGHACLIHVVPALLEALDIPYTGCPAFAQWMTSNKLAAKQRFAHCAIATPELWSGPDSEGGSWIVKSVWEHASLGIDDDSVVADPREVPTRIAERRHEFGGEWFAERYIPGRELNVAVVASGEGPRVLPVAEIRFRDFARDKPQIVGYRAKWVPDSIEYSGTMRTFAVEPELSAAAGRIAIQCWESFQLAGYARIDFRVDAGGRLFVLEVNANPCLSSDAGFAAMLAAADIGFPDALGWIVDDARSRAVRPGISKGRRVPV